ncbi:MAG: VWA domain-containing protein [Candidatus Thiodiazotropha sp. (ex Dulcina madagascariensis)]|nr:VWA domain-containing protein [Candidatus Thiodiazotropha sp. (ex Dulcina madagascariensis)]
MKTSNHSSPRQRLTLSLGLLFCLSLTNMTAYADDIEIYLQEPPDPVPPNVMFVLDESGSMDSGNPSRRDRLEDAMRTLINDADMGNVNAALMGYTTRWGNNGPLFLRALSGEFKLIDGNRSSFLTQVDSLSTISYTPTVKAMEAAVDWFRRDRTFTDYFGNAMTSPIAGDPEDNWCRPNHMVVLTDGRPNSNSTTSGQAYGLSSYEGTNCASDSTSRWQNGRCAREIAAWAFDNDLETGSGWKEQQNIVTHTIGFDTNDDAIENFMRSISDAGGGRYYPATSVADLVDAFTSIVTEAMESIPYAYTAPVVPFNQDNSAVSGDRIYVPLLVPAAEIFWKGNLKSYTITVDADGNLDLRDADTDPVVNELFEFIDSRDHWSASPDGGDPLVGGAADQMNASGNRAIFTNINPLLPLSDITNRVHRDNGLITNAIMNVGTDPVRIELLDWISWDPSIAIDASHEGEMGAPLHTQPVVVSYSAGDVVYLPTSEGVLEAIDADTGEELWAFMPTDLLADIQTIKNNNASATPYYGLDGPLTVYTTGSKKMAIFGMRRGGRNYYMLDITDRLNPVFETVISNATTGFERLGQTWSKPLFMQMEIEGSDALDVLVFGGGYDPDQDGATTRADDSEGNTIYIVRASDGALIKTISSDASSDLIITGMDNGVAGDLLPVDINANGIVDRLYAADVGGRIIRVDIPDKAFGSTTMKGGVIADVYEGNTGFRRFFNTPEVGYYNVGGVQYLAILIGSGNRPSPLDSSVTDRFYMIKDYAVWAAPTTYTMVTPSDLYNATNNLVQDGTHEQRGNATIGLAAAKGWYIDFATAEKSFSNAVLYDYAVLFTTYSTVRSIDLAACEARGANGVGRLYSLNMKDGSAMFDGLGGSEGTLDIGDRSRVLSMLGMPPSPTLVFPSGGPGILGHVVKALVGLEEVYEWPDRFHAISWEEVIND